jgi:hypothetical protein
LLANVYLHFTFDLWVKQWRKRHARGDMVVVRFADDSVLGFQHKDDAERFLVDMRERLKRFSLSLHPDKTRLIEFGRFAASNRKRRGLGKPETFTFLGFTFICGTARAGHFFVQRRTRRDRMQATLRRVKEELRKRRHHSTSQQGHWLKQVVQGFYAYHAVPGNGRATAAFRFHVSNLWWNVLARRSQRDNTTWARMQRLFNHWLPTPRTLHPWPRARFDVLHPRWEPSA